MSWDTLDLSITQDSSLTQLTLRLTRPLFQKYDWMEFSGNLEEAIPPNMPPPLGKDVDLWMMVDSDHAGDKRTRHSRTGFLIFCNLDPIVWLLNSKRPLRPQFLVLNLLLWSTESKHWGDWAIRFVWWAYLWPDPHTLMETMSPKCLTCLSLSWPYRKSAIQSVTTQFENWLQWVNHWLLTLRLEIT